MTKAEIVAAVTEEIGVTKKVAEQAVAKVFDSIMDAAKAGDKVAIAGFGVFDVRERAARKGRNPQTGEPVDIAASKSVGFKPAKAFKDML